MILLLYCLWMYSREADICLELVKPWVNVCCLHEYSHVKGLIASAPQEWQSLPSLRFWEWWSLPWSEYELIVCAENVQSSFLSPGIYTLKTAPLQRQLQLRVLNLPPITIIISSLFSCIYVHSPVQLYEESMPCRLYFPDSAASPSEIPVPLSDPRIPCLFICL